MLNALFQTNRHVVVRSARGSARTFAASASRSSAVKPGSDSEATVPGGGGTEDIANSSGAYDGDKTNPDAATSKIESENKADFSTSANNPETSEAATKAHHASDARPSKQQQKTPSRTDLGGTAARKGKD
ncbi:uncharacterized protein PFL1_00587 [Pseudozyma flocculosa PF-1]|uniref:Uncharacterized protein n=1 Tax=Pseudozyma flocculosa TaxID=84751 RepID=A0A5C3ESF5_9BASI|nr:uncharacterized protein PFL1_00587 [Pseudozyma flocculosa PF-1]EPQ32391.1 hypothetical protein PFL1_00587 [Pseudozyma flocculosa PF-1]SPO34635.1 uncharacterized protein PSFLO_00106 [Pseudozyma flocculosa]